MTDLRDFEPRSVERLPAPNWPTPIANQEFVRSFGSVRRRRRGGLKGWSAEDHYCDASRAISFLTDRTGCIRTDRFLWQPLFKRLFSDGLAMLKVEIGFWMVSVLRRSDVKHAIHDLLRMQVRIRGSGNSPPLHSADKYVAELYDYSSTAGRGANFEGRSRRVLCETPSIFAEIAGSHLRKVAPKSAKRLPLGPSIEKTFLYNWNVNIENKEISVNVMSEAPGDSTYYPPNEATIEFRRSVRLYVSRLAVEYANLRRVLKCVAKGEIRPEPYSKGSDFLQEYLDETIKKIGRFESHLASLAGEEDGAAIAAKGALAAITPGELNSLQTQIRRLSPRPAVQRRVDSMLPQIFVEGDFHMGDNFVNNGVAGAFGTNPNVKAVNQSQTVNLAPLTQELERLRGHIAALPPSGDRTTELSHVEGAVTAARSGDRSKVASLLKAAGDFTLKAIKELGLPLLGELIKSHVER